MATPAAIVAMPPSLYRTASAFGFTISGFSSMTIPLSSNLFLTSVLLTAIEYWGMFVLCSLLRSAVL